jgi:hypothetical protein
MLIRQLSTLKPGRPQAPAQFFPLFTPSIPARILNSPPSYTGHSITRSQANHGHQIHDPLPSRRKGKVKLEDRIVRSIKQRKGVVILRSEVAPLGSTAQVGRVLSKLVADGKLVRVSKGVFAKTRINKFTGKLAPAATFERIAAETFRKLKVSVQPGHLAREYNAGATTQIPMDGVVSTGARRITRKIQVGSRTVKYEKNNGRAGSAIPEEYSGVPSHGLEE